MWHQNNHNNMTHVRHTMLANQMWVVTLLLDNLDNEVWVFELEGGKVTLNPFPATNGISHKRHRRKHQRKKHTSDHDWIHRLGILEPAIDAIATHRS
jgi:hypothetical protein